MNNEDEYINEEYYHEIPRNNKDYVSKSEYCQELIKQLYEIEKFLGKFGFLTFGRDTGYSIDINDGKSIIVPKNFIIDSLQLTMINIIACCKNGSIADANALLRKYRDDLFFYIYLSIYTCDKNINSERKNIMKKQINNWLNNQLKDLSIGEVLGEISKYQPLNKIINKYDLKDSFEKIRINLNNFVHSNGCIFYNRNINVYKLGEFENNLKQICDNAIYFTMVYLILQIICTPHLIMAQDYFDHLDCSDIPPENSEFWVDPCVENFIKKNISVIDENCIQYLRENTQMQF